MKVVDDSITFMYVRVHTYDPFHFLRNFGRKGHFQFGILLTHDDKQSNNATCRAACIDSTSGSLKIRSRRSLYDSSSTAKMNGPSALFSLLNVSMNELSKNNVNKAERKFCAPLSHSSPHQIKSGILTVQ